MATHRKNAREIQVERRGPSNQARPKSNVARRVDPGISISQMAPVVLDYYSVCCYRSILMI